MVLTPKLTEPLSVTWILAMSSPKWKSYLFLFCWVHCSSSSVYPLVVAAHPQEPNQFAVGLTDGSVYVFEPLESENKWKVPRRIDNGSATTSTSSPSQVVILDQPQG